jgi:hypothetical protein
MISVISSVEQQIDEWIKSGVLLTLKILNHKGGYIYLHGRILSYEPDTHSILFYEDDYKNVQNITLNEIDNIELANTFTT